MAEDRLAAARARIDALDEKLQALIAERAGIAREIAEIKAEIEGGEGNNPAGARGRDPARRCRAQQRAAVGPWPG